MKWKNKNEEETKRLETKCHIRRGIIISPPLIFLHVEMEGKKNITLLEQLMEMHKFIIFSITSRTAVVDTGMLIMSESIKRYNNKDSNLQHHDSET